MGAVSATSSSGDRKYRGLWAPARLVPDLANMWYWRSLNGEPSYSAAQSAASGLWMCEDLINGRLHLTTAIACLDIISLGGGHASFIWRGGLRLARLFA